MNYNINQLQGMLDLFRGVVNDYGRTQNAVKVYRDKVNMLLSNGKVQKLEVDYIYRLIGMSNTDKIKWNITLQRLQKFMGAMNYVMCCNQETEREKCLASLLEKSLIDKNIYKYIKEVYSVQCDIKFSLDKVKSNKEFGKFGTSQPINISTNNKVNNTKPYKKITLLDIDTIFDRAEREYKIQRVIDLADVSKFANYRATRDQLERCVPGAILKYIQEYGYEDICDFFWN